MEQEWVCGKAYCLAGGWLLVLRVMCQSQSCLELALDIRSSNSVSSNAGAVS